MASPMAERRKGSGGGMAMRLALWGLVALALLAVAWFQFIAPRLNAALGDTLGHGDYRLETTDGGEFTQATLKGGPSLVFFGFTHCPEVCPTTLADISVWQDELGQKADDLRVFFVTVDPERDTVDALEDYVGWVPNAVGVTGTPEEVEKAISAFHIYARKVPLEDGDYTMDHSAYVMVYDRNGRFVAPIGYQEDYERALATLQRVISG